MSHPSACPTGGRHNGGGARDPRSFLSFPGAAHAARSRPCRDQDRAAAIFNKIGNRVATSGCGDAVAVLFEYADGCQDRAGDRLCDAADQPVLPAGPVSFLRPRIHHHHLPHDPRGAEPWCRRRWRSTSRWSNTNSSACRTSTGFGDYTETGQVIPVRYKGQHGGYVHSMYLERRSRRSPAAASCGAFPKKLASPKIVHEGEVIVGTLHYGSVSACATGTMGYKHREARPRSRAGQALAAPNFLIKIIPHVDGSPRICELVRYYLTDITVKEAWTAPAALDLRPHVMAESPSCRCSTSSLPSISSADLTLGFGEVVHDYLADHSRLAASTTQPEKIRA